MKLFNSLTRRLETFKPLHANQVGVYTCGPTVYSYPHIGNWRTFVLGDLVARTLKYLGYQVHYLMNITDVGHLTGDNLGDADIGEDLMEKAARKERKTAWEVAEFYTRDFKKGYKKLNLTMPTLSNGEEGFCVATEHIKEQIQLIKAIEKHGYTYKIADGVYFNTGKYEQEGNQYGQLSTLDQIKVGARVEPAAGKKDPRDFALWKFSPNPPTGGEKRQMEWESPWGVGFPGWHIECSAMSMKYLGDQFDIHIGGEDHKSIHHPNEIAQSEAATGKKPFVTYWLHCTFLQVDGGKMGKSKGNVYTLQDIEEKGFKPEHLRYFYLTAHYRQPLNFTWENLEKAKESYERLVEHYAQWKASSELFPGLSVQAQGYNHHFLHDLENDLQMPLVLATIWNVARDTQISSWEKFKLLQKWDQVLGLGLEARSKTQEARKYTGEASGSVIISSSPLSGGTVSQVDHRELARQEQDWQKADELRQEIEAQGYIVKDTSQGPVVKKKE
jgi:cysteinyl-tRNA synthetase